MQSLMIAGGAGFIGSNFVRYILRHHPDYRVVVYDRLTYAGNLDNLEDLAGDPRFTFVRGDIADQALVKKVIREHKIDAVLNFAAETHVDRSILDPTAFIHTDVLGTYGLLEVIKTTTVERFVQVSTDEVYGSIPTGSFQEEDPPNPTSPYAASKAAGDLLSLAYYKTYNLPVLTTRGSNTFGPCQYPEKFIPLFITNALEDKPLPLYGDGRQVRDWLYVEDHCAAIDLVLHKGKAGEIYNIGGDNERTNIEVAELLLRLLNKPRSLIQHVTDRPAHDRRYSLDTVKIKTLGFQPREDFETALRETVDWYEKNRGWWEKIRDEEFWQYYEKNYGKRKILTP